MSTLFLWQRHNLWGFYLLLFDFENCILTTRMMGGVVRQFLFVGIWEESWKTDADSLAKFLQVGAIEVINIWVAARKSALVASCTFNSFGESRSFIWCRIILSGLPQYSKATAAPFFPAEITRSPCQVAVNSSFCWENQWPHWGFGFACSWWWVWCSRAITRRQWVCLMIRELWNWMGNAACSYRAPSIIRAVLRWWVHLSDYHPTESRMTPSHDIVGLSTL